MARVQAPGTQFAVVAAHAPHQLFAAVEVEAWWSRLQRLIRRHFTGIPLVMGIDANTHPGPEPAIGIGNLLCQKAHPLFGRFAGALEGLGMWIPSTFEECSRDASLQCTYLRPEHEAVDDYIVTTSDVTCVPHTCQTMDSIAMLNVALDHIPVSAEVTFPGVQRVYSRARRAAYDRNAVAHATEAQVEETVKRLVALPPVPYALEPTSHLHIVNSHISEVLAEDYPPVAKAASTDLVTMDTRSLLKAAAVANKKLLNSAKFTSRSATLFVFYFWASEVGLRQCWRQWDPVYRFATATQVKHALRAGAIYADAFATASRALDHDLATRVTEKAMVIAIAAAQANLGQLHRELRPFLKPMAPRYGAPVRDHTGTLVYDASRRQEVVCQHFAGLMDGRRTTFELLVDECAGDLCSHRLDEVVRDPALVPSLGFIARASRRMTALKGLGPDGIGSEVGRRLYAAVPELLHPVYVKASLWIHPPLQSRGGALVTLFKGLGERATLGNSRDITIGGTTGKPLAQFVRQATKPMVEDMVEPTMFGSGFNGGATDVGHLYVRSFGDAAQAHGLACLVFFSDVVKAFARACRGVAFGCHTDEQLLYRLRALGIPEEEVQRLWAELQFLCGLPMEERHAHLSQLMAETHRHTWFCVDDAPGVVATDSGTLAGFALGDLVFSIIMTKLLATIHSDLRAEGLVHQFSRESATHLLPDLEIPEHAFAPRECSYMDDCAFPIFAAASCIRERGEAAVSIIVRRCMEFGLRVNFARHKSGTIALLYGPGARKARRDLLTDTPWLDIELLDGSVEKLHVLKIYKHLGTQAIFGTSIGPEIAYRKKQAGSCYSPLRRRLFKLREVPVRTRAMIITSVVTSKLFYNCSTWPSLNKQERQQLRAAYMRHIRIALKGLADGWTADDEALAALGLPSLEVVLVLARVRLFSRLVRRCNVHVWALLCIGATAQRSWIRALHRDLSALTEVCEEWKPYHGATLSTWWTACAVAPRRFVDRVAASLQRQENSTRESWQPGLSNDPAAAPPCAGRVVCPVCSIARSTHQALQVHMFKQHNIKRALRWFVDTPWCPCCLLYLHTRQRLISHLAEKGDRCRDFVLKLPMVSAEQHEALELEAKAQSRELVAMGLRCTAVVQAAATMDGPLTLTAVEAGVSHEHRLRDGKYRRSTPIVAGADGPHAGSVHLFDKPSCVFAVVPCDYGLCS